MHQDPDDDADLVEKAEKCYRKDQGWEDFKPVEEVVVYGDPNDVVELGADDVDTDSAAELEDPLEGLDPGGGGVIPKGPNDGDSDDPPAPPPECPTTRAAGGAENCTCPDDMDPATEDVGEETWRYCVVRGPQEEIGNSLQASLGVSNKQMVHLARQRMSGTHR